jgi:hypothetical protein
MAVQTHFEGLCPFWELTQDDWLVVLDSLVRLPEDIELTQLTQWLESSELLAWRLSVNDAVWNADISASRFLEQEMALQGQDADIDCWWSEHRLESLYVAQTVNFVASTPGYLPESLMTQRLS